MAILQSHFGKQLDNIRGQRSKTPTIRASEECCLPVPEILCEDGPVTQCEDVAQSVPGSVVVEEEVLDTVCTDVVATQCQTLERTQCTNTSQPVEHCQEVTNEECTERETRVNYELDKAKKKLARKQVTATIFSISYLIGF